MRDKHRSVSAIVVSYQTGFRLKECLWALLSDPDVDQLILVDNGNPEGMTVWLRDLAAQQVKLTYLPTGKNLGFGAGINRGVRVSDGTDLLIINPDCVLKRGSIEAFQTIRHDKTPLVIGGRIFDEAGQECRGGRRREVTLFRAMVSLIGVDSINMHREHRPEDPIPVDAVSGALMYLSRADFDALEGYDEAYFLHFEDLDLCARAKKAGGAVIYTPHAAGLHFGATSDVPSAFVKGHKAKSLSLYLRQHAKGSISRTLAGFLSLIIRLAFALRG